MDWILEHLKIVVFALVFIVWLFRTIAGSRSGDGAETPGAGTQEDPAEAQRTREIQEEIRRRILARQRGETVAPPPVPETMAAPPPLPTTSAYDEDLDDPDYVGEGPNRPMPTTAAHREADAAREAILEQQRVLAEQLHALRMARAQGGSVQPASPLQLPAPAMARIAAHGRSCRRELIRDLHQPTSLRRAILLKEILGPPLALQRGVQLPRR